MLREIQGEQLVQFRPKARLIRYTVASPSLHARTHFSPHFLKLVAHAASACGFSSIFETVLTQIEWTALAEYTRDMRAPLPVM